LVIGSWNQRVRATKSSTAFRADAHHLERADLAGVRDMRAAAGLQVDARDVEQAHAPLAARRRDRHGAHQLRPRIELRVGDPDRARRGVRAHELVHARLDLVLHQLLHLDVEVEVRLVLADAAAGHRRLHRGAQEVQRRVQAHQAMATVPVERQIDLGADGGRGARFEQMQYRVARGAFARVDHAPIADAPGVAGLAAAHRVEDRAVELHRVLVHGDHRRVAGLEVRVIPEEELRHEL
jgi:hypothetical protein